MPAPSMFRSEDMQYVSITMTNDSAHDTIAELGNFGQLHIVDLNAHAKDAPTKQLQLYKKRLADCTYFERKLNHFQDEINKRNIPQPTLEPTTISTIKSADVLRDVELFLEPIERELVTSENFYRDNNRQMNEISERIHVLTVCSNVSIQSEIDRLQQDSDNYGTGAFDRSDKFRSFLCGTLISSAQDQFKRMLYRVSRGNAFVRFEAIPEPIFDPATDEQVNKSVFYIVFLGEELKNRIMKMCDVMHATLYELHTENRAEILKMIENLQVELMDKRVINTSTEEQINNLLSKLAWNENTSPLNDWKLALHKEKCICDIFMKSHFYLTMIAIEGWVPVSAIDELKEAVRCAVLGSRNPAAAIEIDPSQPIREPEQPPTFFKTNKFTETYQSIVDTYGVPRYKEANPALFTIITFPFLFGVMYGDIGHGTFLFLFSLFMILFENSLERKRKVGELGEIAEMAFGGRYVMVLMGAFGIYAGTVYNDIISLRVPAFKSQWILDHANATNFRPDPSAGTYPWGVDYNWQRTSNQLAFYNSMKMKIAVILGVAQMVFGVLLSLSNHLYFQDRVSVWFEFIPRMIFLLCTFGYMDIMIIIKWCTDWSKTSTNDAPNLIQMMIGMFLGMGKVPDNTTPLYPGQSAIQLILLLLAVFSVPVMLLGKPLVHNAHHKRQRDAELFARRRSQMMDDLARERESSQASRSEQDFHALNDHRDGKSPINGINGSKDIRAISSEDIVVQTPSGGRRSGGHGHGEEFSFSDELIHNAIHTIEYVLGTVSNTASYLRLWALSLAHAELAEVFWSKMIQPFLTASNPIIIFVGYAVWFAATFSVLLAMDVLECFLHALRLHWVEFQNKFYYADGKAFEPFSYVDRT